MLKSHHRKTKYTNEQVLDSFLYTPGNKYIINGRSLAIQGDSLFCNDTCIAQYDGDTLIINSSQYKDTAINRQQFKLLTEADKLLLSSKYHGAVIFVNDKEIGIKTLKNE